jgi:hypothetical protein
MATEPILDQILPFMPTISTATLRYMKARRADVEEREVNLKAPRLVRMIASNSASLFGPA